MKAQSFHKKGKSITARSTTRISITINNNTVVAGMVSKGANAALDKRINKISCGMMIGNPSTAMIAAFCWAFAAIAARKVKTRLKLQPPSSTRPMNCPAFCMGLPRNRVKRNRLSMLMTSMSMEKVNNEM